MTPEELERRRTVVGASEVALLFGLPSYGGRTVSDLWAEKKYGVERESKGNESTRLGLKLEATVLDAAEEFLNEPIVDRQRWFTKGTNAATLDGRTTSLAVVDAKTSGIVGPSTLGQWGEEMTDEVPESYLVQIQAQMVVTGSELGYIAALIGGRGFAMFRIEPVAELQALIVKKSAEFIESLRSDIPPPEPPQLDTLKRLRRQPDKIVDLPDDLRDAYDEARAHFSEAKDAKESADRRILAALGDAECGRLSGGVFTYFSQSRSAYTVEESSYRVLRFRND